MTETPISYQGTVYPWQCDSMGHMNVMWYSGKFDEATWHFFAQIGMTRKYMADQNCGMAALEQTIKYIKELHPGDIVTVRTHIVEIGAKTVRFMHEMCDTNSGDPVATSEILGVHLDTIRRKGIVLPNEVREKAEQLMK